MDPTTLAPEPTPEAAPVIPEKFRYWAAATSDEIGDKLVSRVRDYSEDSLVKQIRQTLNRAYAYYFGLDPAGVHATSQVLRDGEEGELAAIRINHSRALINTLKNIITESKVVWSPKALNADAESQKAVKLAAALLEYYFSEEQVLKFAMQALEQALVFSEAFIFVDWDHYAGPVIATHPTTGEPVKGGDVCFYNVSTWDVFRDPVKRSWDECDWIIVRLRKNKYNLLANYADLTSDGGLEAAEKILNAGSIDLTLGANATDGAVKTTQTDDVDVYVFVHKKTAAIPEGRHTVFLSNEAVLEDGPLADDELPIFRVASDELIGTPFGYSSFLDILGVQEVIDSLHTSIATNQTTFATQLITAPKGSEITPDDLGGGMRLIYYPPDSKPPAPLQLTQTAPEVFRYVDQLKEDQRLLIGINSVVQGEAPSGELSGSALALLNEKVKSQSSNTQGNYYRLLERLGGYVIRLITKFCPDERKVAIVGETNRYLVQEVSYDSTTFAGIHSVRVELGNPMSQSPQGRWEMAKELAQMVPGLNPMQLLQVITTGSTDPLTNSLQKQILLIKGENEALMRGEMQPVLNLDDHQLHIREHAGELADPEVRKNPMAVQAMLGHIGQHQQIYMTTDPMILMLSGQKPPPMMGPPGMPGMPPGGPPGAGGSPLPPGAGPQGGPPPPKPQAPAGNPQAGKPPVMPNMPQNPENGQRVPPAPPPTP